MDHPIERTDEMTHVQIEIDKLMADAKKSRGNPSALYVISNLLKDLGATDKANQVLGMAHDAERTLAGMANR
jgi:hypothetical protein